MVVRGRDGPPGARVAHDGRELRAARAHARIRRAPREHPVCVLPHVLPADGVEHEIERLAARVELRERVDRAADAEALRAPCPHAPVELVQPGVGLDVFVVVPVVVGRQHQERRVGLGDVDDGGLDVHYDAHAPGEKHAGHHTSDAVLPPQDQRSARRLYGARLRGSTERQ